MTDPTQTPLTRSSINRADIAVGTAFLVHIGTAIVVQSMTLMIATLAPLAIASILAASHVSQTGLVD